MRIGANRGQIYDAQKAMRAKWDDLDAVWADDARREFGETVWEPLDREVSDLMRAIDQLAVLFHQIRADCECG